MMMLCIGIPPGQLGRETSFGDKSVLKSRTSQKFDFKGASTSC